MRFQSHSTGMITAIKFGSVGFLAGLTVALALTAIGNNRTIPGSELHLLWPAAAIGLDFSDWADGNPWHFLRLLAVYLSNGLLYAVLASCFGGLVELLRRY